MEYSSIGESTLALEDAYGNGEVEFTVNTDEDQKMFSVFCSALDSPQMEEFHRELFWNIPKFFQIDLDWTYKFVMTTYKDIGVSVEKAVFYASAETKYGLMPVPEIVTKEEWETFTSQLIYTINGETVVMPPPFDF